MANEEQLSILKQGVEAWNKWRYEHRKIKEGSLDVDLNPIDLSNADLNTIHLNRANLSYANLSRADFSDAQLSNTDLFAADLSDAIFKNAYIHNSDLIRANLSRANFIEANLFAVTLLDANLNGANFNKATFIRSHLNRANLSNADFSESELKGVNLSRANLTNANLSNANLEQAILVETNLSKANLEGCRVYGISAWSLKLDEAIQKNLKITPDSEPTITVDDLEVAQFIYLMLNNQKIRNVIDTLTSKAVLILGRFSLPERKGILDALRNKLREYDLLPIVFDFDRPIDKDFTETIKTLAGLCYFVIADVTNPKSSPLELQATVPDYQIPFVPIIQEGESPFAMMVDLQKKYNWVLNTVTYDSKWTLMKALKPLIIDPAMKKRQELRIIKAQEPEIISAKEYLDKGKK